jgi:3-methylcrotonyl-CoA carboxylase alpha subunit
MQVFADAQGGAVHLFERDCSIQRRHQKILEEAPAPGMTADRRRAMSEAALSVCRTIGYRGAGTVEFIVDSAGQFYFMEMNTRLQVEHPVTEMITGLDLVEWQLRVAAGEALPLAQDQIQAKGHAIEARLYAEDPESGFLPMAGRLSHLEFPADSRHVRVDTGVRSGDSIGIHYDPMIAKLVVWDRDRAGALARLVRALGQVETAGLVTNRAFLKRLAENPDLARGAVDTGFIQRHAETLLAPETAPNGQVLALAALHLVLENEAGATRAAWGTSDRFSPWAVARGWRLNDRGFHRFLFKDGHTERPVTVRFGAAGYRVDLPDGSFAAAGHRMPDGTMQVELDGHRFAPRVVVDGSRLTVFADGETHRLDLVDPVALAETAETSEGRLAAPMPGRIVQVLVRPGDKVETGQALLVLEAMKMEHTIKAPAAGTVAAVHFAVGDQVEEGADLAELDQG